MTGRGASLALFLYDIHAGLPDRHDGPICRRLNRRVAHRLKGDFYAHPQLRMLWIPNTAVNQTKQMTTILAVP